MNTDHLSDYANAFRAGRSLMSKGNGSPSATAGQVQRRAELFGAIGSALLAKPYEERRAILAHLAPALAREGLPRGVVAHFDPTDDAIVKSLRGTRAIGAVLHADDEA